MGAASAGGRACAGQVTLRPWHRAKALQRALPSNGACHSILSLKREVSNKKDHCINVHERQRGTGKWGATSAAGATRRPASAAHEGARTASRGQSRRRGRKPLGAAGSGKRAARRHRGRGAAVGATASPACTL